MLAFLKRWFGWLAVPSATSEPDPQTDADAGIPPGIYLFEPGTALTGHEPLSVYAAARVGDADRPIIGYAYR
ncbi:hypothetical protein ACLBYG_22280 [Methylobacterium sp. D53M]